MKIILISIVVALAAIAIAAASVFCGGYHNPVC